MREDLKALTVLAIRRSLRSLARLAMKVGVTSQEVEAQVRESFFECARADHGLSGRPTNLARVAVLTGLSRKECSRLKQSLEEGGRTAAAQNSRMNPAARVMSAWSTDSRLSKKGEPLELLFSPDDSDGTPSFTELVAEQVGDIPLGAVVAELDRVGALERTGNRVRLVKRSFLPDGLNEEKLRILANQFEDLGDTVLHNLEAGALPRMQRYVVNENLPEEHLEAFQRFATSGAQHLLEQLDEWLCEREQPNETPSATTTASNKTCRTGVGVYFFQNE